jgi:predicted esterase
MLDLNRIAALHQSGADSLTGLKVDEQQVFDAIMLSLSQIVTAECLKRGVTPEQVGIIAFSSGVALGLKLSVQNGEVQER